MELIVQILMLFILINTILKLSFWKLWQSALFGLLCGVFILFVNDYAITQSKTQITDFLNNATVMQDTAVLVTIESVIYIGFCFIALKELFGRKVSRGGKVLHWYPSFLIFPVLFYCLTQLIFTMPGQDFKTIAWGFAIAMVIAFPLLSMAFKYLLPEKDQRLEVHFLVTLLVCILGLLSTVNGNVTYAAAKEPINFKALFVSLGLFVIMFLIGFVWNKIKWARLQKKALKEKHQQ